VGSWVELIFVTKRKHDMSAMVSTPLTINDVLRANAVDMDLSDSELAAAYGGSFSAANAIAFGGTVAAVGIAIPGPAGGFVAGVGLGIAFSGWVWGY
jgi:hypothetical protein